MQKNNRMFDIAIKNLLEKIHIIHAYFETALLS